MLGVKGDKWLYQQKSGPGLVISRRVNDYTCEPKCGSIDWVYCYKVSKLKLRGTLTGVPGSA